MGSTFYIHGKPATIIGVATKGFYGDRIDTNPPSFFFPLNAMDEVIGASFFTDPDKQWAYIIGRVKPRTSLPALQAKASAPLKHQLATLKTFNDPRAQKVLTLAHVVLTPAEIGVRMARGAAPSRVIGMIMRGAMLRTVAGLAIGIPVAIFCVRYVKSQLYEITSVNAPVMTVAIGVL